MTAAVQPADESAKGADTGDEAAARPRIIQHVSHPIATIGQRFWALLIDLVIVTIVATFIWLLLQILTLELVRIEIFATGTLGLSILYFILFESMDGQTVGKMVLHIKVVSAETMKKPGIFPVIVRNVLRIVDAFPPNFYIIGFIVAILNERHQRLGDMLAKTVVVREEERIG